MSRGERPFAPTGGTVNYDDLLNALRQYFADRSRTKDETRHDLLALSDEALIMAESLDDDDE
jgi:hypothetical protein